MSLINQMLRDLEQQRKSGRPGKAPDWPAVNNRPVPKDGRRGRWIAVFFVAVLSSVLVAGYFYLNTDRSVPQPPQQARTKVPLTPPAPVVEPKPVPLPAPIKEVATIETAVPEPVVAASDKPIDSTSANPPTYEPTLREPPPPPAEPPRRLETGDVPLTAAGIPAAPPKIKKTAPPLTLEEQAEQAFLRGTEARDQGRLQVAEKAFRQALDLVPILHRSREQLALLLLSSGRVSEADSLLAEGLILAPDHTSFRQAYSRLLADRGALFEARALLQKDPVPELVEAPGYHALLAALQQRIGQPQKAADIYEKLIMFNPRVGSWWFGLAAALEQAGAAAEARRAYQAALQRPDLAPALRNYAQDRLRTMSAQ